MIEVEFSLDEKEEIVCHRKIIVSHRTGNQGGAEFCTTDDAYHRISSGVIEKYLAARAEAQSS